MKLFDIQDLVIASDENNPVASAVFGKSVNGVPDSGYDYHDDFMTPAKYIGGLLVSFGTHSVYSFVNISKKITKALKQRLRDLKILINEEEYLKLDKMRTLSNIESNGELAAAYRLIFETATWDFTPYTLENNTTAELRRKLTSRIQKLITTRVLSGDKVPWDIDLIPVSITETKLVVVNSEYDRVYELKFDKQTGIKKYNRTFIANQLRLIAQTIRLIRGQYSDYDIILEEYSRLKPSDNLIKYQVVSRLIDNKLATLSAYLELM